MVETTPTQSQQPETAISQMAAPKPEEIEQMKEVLPFLDNKDTRGQALEIILPFTGTAESRQLFFGLELCKKMLRLLGEEDLTPSQQTSVFQILINIVQDQFFVDECIHLNVARRVFDFLMRNVKPTTDQATSAAKIVED